MFLFSPGSCSTVTSDLPALFLRGWGKTWPTFAWCQFSSLGRLLLLLPRGRRSRCRTVSSPFSSWLGCSWRDWFEKIWGPPRSCSIEFASSSLPCPCKAREGLPDFSPLPPPFGRQEGQSKPEMEAGKLLVVDGELMAVVGSKGFLRSPHGCLLGLSQDKAPVAPPARQGQVDVPGAGLRLAPAIPWPYPHTAQTGTAGVPQSLMN